MADEQARDAQTAQRVDEDEPFRVTPDTPAAIASPLAVFAGAKPASPPWFDRAVAQVPERSFVAVEGARIELLTWGERGKPGLIFVHGNSAHADWWSFIAPFFAADYRVAALSLSGMGASDWRETYSFETYAEEIYACARAAGLYEAQVGPVYIGHSFGGAQVFASATRHPERMSACILVDTGFGGPPTPEEFAAMRAAAIARGEDPGPARRLSQRDARNRVYPTLEAALTRFRFMPPQVPGNLFIADFIARRSLKRAPMTEGDGEGGAEGWTWRFDPGLWAKLDRSGFTVAAPAAPPAPMIHIYGDRSEIIRRHNFQGEGSRLPPGLPTVIIPDSEHHIMVDQPLALVSALRAALTLWAPKADA